MMYLVKICEGERDCYQERDIFVTRNKFKARSYCNRFNKIVDNVHKLETIRENNFWSSYVMYENPRAIYKNIEVR